VSSSHAGIIRDIFERAWNRADFDGLDRLFPSEFSFHYRRATKTMDLDDLERTVTAWRQAFPDLHFTIQDLIEQGDLVAARLTHAGTHMGPIREFGATGRRFEIDAMYFFRFEDDLLVEVWEVDDEYAMWEQLRASG
jgi:steroid delta-isomerase-like uncharacterized protein